MPWTQAVRDVAVADRGGRQLRRVDRRVVGGALVVAQRLDGGAGGRRGRGMPSLAPAPTARARAGRARAPAPLHGRRSPSPVDPFLQVRAFGGDRGVEAVARHDQVSGGSGTASGFDRLDDRGEVAAPGVARPAREQRVAAEEQRPPLDQEDMTTRGVAGRDGPQAAGGPPDHAVASTWSGLGSMAASSAVTCTVKPASRSWGTAWMWSQCPWVSSTLVTPSARHSSSSLSCSLAASSSTASPVRCSAARTRCWRTGRPPPCGPPARRLR